MFDSVYDDHFNQNPHTIITDARPIMDLWNDPVGGFAPQLADQDQPKAKSLEQMLKEDPDLAEEAARRDPKAWEQYVSHASEQVALLFRQANPDYVRSEKNHAAIVSRLLKSALGIDYIQGDDAVSELFAAGRWTVKDLQETYRECLRRGELDVPKGAFKTLSREELLEVIATLRVSGPEMAIASYLQFALGSRRAIDLKKLMVDSPALCARAVISVFAYYRSIDGPTLSAFTKAKLDRVILPTFRDVEEAWNAWQLERYQQSEIAAERTAAEPIRDPRSYSDAELAEQLAAARKEHYKSQRRS